MSTTIADRPFKPRVTPAPSLSPTRQRLADAIRNLNALEVQHAILEASVRFDGKASQQITAAQDAVEAAEQDLKSAQQAQIAEMGGGATAPLSPRRARDAISKAKESLADAEHALAQIKQQIAALARQMTAAIIVRDNCIEAVIADHFGPKVATLAAEIAQLQNQLVERAQLLLAIAPRSVTGALPYSMDAIAGTAGQAWQISAHPMALLANHRAALAALKLDPTVKLGD